jgi:hypothetical protein
MSINQKYDELNLKKARNWLPETFVIFQFIPQFDIIFSEICRIVLLICQQWYKQLRHYTYVKNMANSDVIIHSSILVLHTMDGAAYVKYGIHYCAFTLVHWEPLDGLEKLRGIPFHRNE